MKLCAGGLTGWFSAGLSGPADTHAGSCPRWSDLRRSRRCSSRSVGRLSGPRTSHTRSRWHTGCGRYTDRLMKSTESTQWTFKKKTQKQTLVNSRRPKHELICFFNFLQAHKVKCSQRPKWVLSRPAGCFMWQIMLLWYRPCLLGSFLKIC